LLLIPFWVHSELISGVDTLQLWQAFDFLGDSAITLSQEEIDSLNLIWPSNDQSKNTIKYDFQYTSFPNTIETVHYKRFFAATYSTDSCFAWKDSINYYFGDFSYYPITHYFRTRAGYYGMIKSAYFNWGGPGLILEWILQLDGSVNLCGPPNKIREENFNHIRKLYNQDF